MSSFAEPLLSCVPEIQLYRCIKNCSQIINNNKIDVFDINSIKLNSLQKMVFTIFVCMRYRLSEIGIYNCFLF